MTKQILMDYIDACELEKETKHDIEVLRKKRKTVVTGSVRGSNPDFPYQEQHFKISGTAFNYTDDMELRRKEKILIERKQNAEKIKTEVESWLNTVPVRMQRIIRYKIFEGMTWEETATKIGKKATGDSVKKEYQRFMKGFEVCPECPTCPDTK